MMTAKEYVEGKVKSYTRLAYKSANSFASSVYHCRKKKKKPHKYSFFSRSHKARRGGQSATDTPQKRRACPCSNTDKPKG